VEGLPGARELLTVLAHDLRNHLTPLRGRLDLIRRRALREGRGEYLHDCEQAVRSVDRLGSLVADILDVSRLEHGLFFVELHCLDVAVLVHDAADAFAGCEETIMLMTPARLIALADPKRLLQALENLLANAVGHSPPGGVVRVQLSEAARDQESWVEIRVSDDGPGIPPALLPRLFECFSTGPDSVGLGMGLYLAQSIAAAHGGTLSVDSKPGHGASFLLAWPTHPVGQNALYVR
jgi:signal transduction histidine kinase